MSQPVREIFPPKSATCAQTCSSRVVLYQVSRLDLLLGRGGWVRSEEKEAYVTHHSVHRYSVRVRVCELHILCCSRRTSTVVLRSSPYWAAELPAMYSYLVPPGNTLLSHPGATAQFAKSMLGWNTSRSWPKYTSICSAPGTTSCREQ